MKKVVTVEETEKNKFKARKHRTLEKKDLQVIALIVLVAGYVICRVIAG